MGVGTTATLVTLWVKGLSSVPSPVIQCIASMCCVSYQGRGEMVVRRGGGVEEMLESPDVLWVQAAAGALCFPAPAPILTVIFLSSLCFGCAL